MLAVETHAAEYSLAGVWEAKKPIKGLDTGVNLYLLLKEEENIVCGVLYETFNDRYVLDGDVLINANRSTGNEIVIYDVEEPEKVVSVNYLAIKSIQREFLITEALPTMYEDEPEYLEVKFKRILQTVPSLQSRRDYTHYPVESFEKHCTPTIRSSGSPSAPAEIQR